MPNIRHSDEETLARLPQGRSFPFGKTNEGVLGALNLPKRTAHPVCTAARGLPEPTPLRVISLGSLLFQCGPIPAESEGLGSGMGAGELSFPHGAGGKSLPLLPFTHLGAAQFLQPLPCCRLQAEPVGQGLFFSFAAYLGS